MILPSGTKFYSDDGTYLATAIADIGGCRPLYFSDFDCAFDIRNFKSRLPLTAAVLRKFRGIV